LSSFFPFLLFNNNDESNISRMDNNTVPASQHDESSRYKTEGKQAVHLAGALSGATGDTNATASSNPLYFL
jgi:hypothetical protein